MWSISIIYVHYIWYMTSSSVRISVDYKNNFKSCGVHWIKTFRITKSKMEYALMHVDKVEFWRWIGESLRLWGFRFKFVGKWSITSSNYITTIWNNFIGFKLVSIKYKLIWNFVRMLLIVGPVRYAMYIWDVELRN